MRNYRQIVPYQARYLVALMVWVALLAGALILKFLLVCCMPLILVMSSFGMNQTQMSAQATANLADLLIYNWPRFPRADWRLLIGRNRGSDNLIQ